MVKPLFALSIALSLLVGCAESVRVRTSPPGAKLFVDGQFAGLTPMEYQTEKRPDMKRQRSYRVELDGYVPEDGHLTTWVSWKRIVGTGFTLGILHIFRGFETFHPEAVDIALVPVSAHANADAPAGAAAHDAESYRDRLRKLRDLYDSGLITRDEYEQKKRAILGGL